MLTEDEIIQLQDIFYGEGLYDYVVEVDSRSSKYYLGLCFLHDRVVKILAPKTYDDALFVLLHEIAHARVQLPKHTISWEQENIRLMHKYNFPRNFNHSHYLMSDNLRSYFKLS